MIPCEVRAHSPGLDRSWLLAEHQALTSRDALRWLQGQAGQLADRLDPDPRTTWWAPYAALHIVASTELDAPAELREWRDDFAASEEAMNTLAAGDPVQITTRDDTAHYTLTAAPPMFRVPPWVVMLPSRGEAS
ncbi:hypothetical protein [Streptomyces microflavus]|uniref:hypothetical protein n=1 Tax=Streptomyces microflavus TaxID=1919 RepID=UPI0036681184